MPLERFRVGDVVRDSHGRIGTVTEVNGIYVTFRCDGVLREVFDFDICLASPHHEDVILEEMRRQYVGGNTAMVVGFVAAMPEIFAEILEPKETEETEDPIGGIEGVPAAYETSYRVVDVEARKGHEWADFVIPKLEPETIARLCELVKEG